MTYCYRIGFINPQNIVLTPGHEAPGDEIIASKHWTHEEYDAAVAYLENLNAQLTIDEIFDIGSYALVECPWDD